MSVVVTLASCRRQIEQRLGAAGIDTPDLDARLLIQYALGLVREDFFLRSAEPLSEDQQALIEAVIRRREAREPVGRILGHREFWSIDLALNADTLEPRPDTETVVEAVLAEVTDHGAGLHLLDLGTGTGCILLSLLAELEQARGLGIDLSPQAVAAATANAERNGLSGRARFQTGDWGNGLTRRFDVVVSNPPYIPTRDIEELSPEVRLHDPVRALDGGDDGLHCYRIIARQLPDLLAPGGLAVLEVGIGQAPDVAELLAAAGLAVIGITHDLGGVERCVRARNRA